MSKNEIAPEDSILNRKFTAHLESLRDKKLLLQADARLIFKGRDVILKFGEYKGRRAVIVDALIDLDGMWGPCVLVQVQIYRQDGRDGFLYGKQAKNNHLYPLIGRFFEIVQTGKSYG